MKAPEKLYFGEGDKGILDIYSAKESDDDIEYIRKDAFIEKAVVWISNNCYIPHSTLEDFKKYMKEE